MILSADFLFALQMSTGVSHPFVFVRMQINPGIEKPYAHLAIQIQQEPNSFETITEIDPFDLAEMFGNVGGFWGECSRWDVTVAPTTLDPNYCCQ